MRKPKPPIISPFPKLVKIHVTFQLKENYKHTYKALLTFPMADSVPAEFDMAS